MVIELYAANAAPRWEAPAFGGEKIFCRFEEIFIFNLVRRRPNKKGRELFPAFRVL
jgi:hypothetical protein